MNEFVNLGIRMPSVSAGVDAAGRARYHLAQTRDSMKRLSKAVENGLVKEEDMDRLNSTMSDLLKREASLQDQVDHFTDIEAGVNEVVL